MVTKSNHMIRKHKLQRLLDGSLESFYWLGFLLADGHFQENGRLIIGISLKDVTVLENFLEFLALDKSIIKVKDGSCRVAIMDVSTMKQLRETYSISPRKSTSPPDLKSISGEALKALSIGFIDGDGSIFKQHSRRGCGITVKVHRSWLEVLDYIFDTTPSYIQSSGYAVVNITENEKVKSLKEFSNLHKLPVLNRKWDKIDLSYTSRTVSAKTNYENVERLYLKGYSVTEISDNLGLLYSTVYMIIRRKIIS